MNVVTTVLEAVGHQGEVTLLAAKAQTALQSGDTASCAHLHQQAGEMIESAVSSLRKPSEKDLARFLAATQYFLGGHYEEAAKVCETIRVSRLPASHRHLYPPFLKQVKERSTPDYADRYRDRINKAYGRAIKDGDDSAAQEVIEILKDHQFLLPQDRMAYVRARCCEVLGEQSAASRFYRDAWRFNPEEPNYLSSYLDSLCKEGRHAEARAIAEEELASQPGGPSSIKAMATSTGGSKQDSTSRKSERRASRR